MAEGVISWSEFKSEAQKLRDGAFSLSPILFRGQADADWKLETTLERSGHDERVAEYYQLMLRIKTEVEIATKTNWENAPSLPEIELLSRNYDEFSRALSNMPHYAYMAYLR